MDFSNDYTYFCMEQYGSSGALAVFGVNISDSGNINGHFKLSLSGSMGELANALEHPQNADAYLTGYVSRTSISPQVSINEDIEHALITNALYLQ